MTEYSAVPYVEFAANGLTECRTCSALIRNQAKHTAWHEHLDDEQA